VSVTAVLAAAAAAAAVLGAWEALVVVERLSPTGIVERIWRPLRMARREGRRPTDAERRRLAVVAAAGLAAAGWLTFGLVGAAMAGSVGPALAFALLRSRQHRYAQDLRRGAAEVARALADAVGAGHSARGAILAVAPGFGGAVGRELDAVAAGLALGATTESALEQLRARARCPAWDALTAAMLLQRDAGGDLVSLLRRLATSLELADRLDAEARTATAQARFTAWLVIGLPFAAAGLGELAAPGMVASLLSHPLSFGLTVAAVALQAVAVLCVRAIARLPRTS
jgi:tight adherence protein B